MNDVQGAIMQLQAECEKLHGTANHLIEEHSQKQVHIDVSLVGRAAAGGGP